MSDLRTLMRREVERAPINANGYPGTLARVHRRQRNRRLAAGALALTVFAGTGLGIWMLSQRRLPPSVTPSAQTQRWVSRYDLAHSGDESQGIAVSPDGTHVFVTGYSFGASKAAAIATVSYDAGTGAKVWAAHYPGPAYVHGPDGPGDELSAAVTVSPDGKQVFVTGATGPAGLEDYATVAYDARTGAQLWVARYDGPDHASDRPRTLAVSPDGKLLYVTGTSGSAGYGEATHNALAFLTVAYTTARGTEAWVARYAGSGTISAAHGLAVDPTGARVFVTGTTGTTGSQSGDYATVAYGARTGALLWAKTYDGEAHTSDSAQAVAVSPTGTVVYVTGASQDDPNTVSGITTIAYSAATGAEKWTSHHDEGESPRSIEVSPDGSSVFVAESSDQGGYLTLALSSSTGAGRWVASYSVGQGSAIATDLALAPDGSKLYVTGASIVGTGTYDFATVTYRAATGAELGVARYSGVGKAAWPDAMSVSPDGSRVFVTGPSDGFGFGKSSDFLTIAYGTK